MEGQGQLRRLGVGLWCVDQDRYAGGLRARLRMCVVEVAPGELLLHSPVAVDDALAAELEGLGQVRHLLAPNLNHHMFLAAAQARWREASAWGAPGLGRKLGRRLEEPGDGPCFGGGVEAVALRGVPFTNEVVLHHSASGTLICTDLVQNIAQEEHFLTRQLWRALGVYGRLGTNRYWRMQTKDRAASRESLGRVLSWGAGRLVMAHGDVVEEGGTARLREALGWLGEL